MDRWQALDGWDHRRWLWPAAPTAPGAAARGSMIFQAGRGDFFEKYLESLAEWHDQGWNLTGFDWRGQSGSGRFLDNPRIGHVSSFADWIADFDCFVKPWLEATPGPHVLAGHSMGGHLIVRYMIEHYMIDHGAAVDALVLSAPMFKVMSKPLSERIAGGLARTLARIGMAERLAWPENERPSIPGSSRQKLLTHDFKRYSDENFWVHAHPELRLGPPSWKWLVEAYASQAGIFAPGTFETLRLPIMIVAAAEDQLVSSRAIAEAAQRMPDARLLMHASAAHELLRESDAIREEVMAAIGAFLDERVPRE